MREAGSLHRAGRSACVNDSIVHVPRSFLCTVLSTKQQDVTQSRNAVVVGSYAAYQELTRSVFATQWWWILMRPINERQGSRSRLTKCSARQWVRNNCTTRALLPPFSRYVLKLLTCIIGTTDCLTCIMRLLFILPSLPPPLPPGS